MQHDGRRAVVVTQNRGMTRTTCTRKTVPVSRCEKVGRGCQALPVSRREAGGSVLGEGQRPVPTVTLLRDITNMMASPRNDVTALVLSWEMLYLWAKLSGKIGSHAIEFCSNTRASPLDVTDLMMTLLGDVILSAALLLGVGLLSAGKVTGGGEAPGKI